VEQRATVVHTKVELAVLMLMEKWLLLQDY